MWNFLRKRQAHNSQQYLNPNPVRQRCFEREKCNCHLCCRDTSLGMHPGKQGGLLLCKVHEHTWAYVVQLNEMHFCAVSERAGRLLLTSPPRVRWSLAAALILVQKFHWQPCWRSHFRMLRSPHSAAALQTLGPLLQPYWWANCSTSRWSSLAAASHVLGLQAQPV